MTPQELLEATAKAMAADACCPVNDAAYSLARAALSLALEAAAKESESWQGLKGRDVARKIRALIPPKD